MEDLTFLHVFSFIYWFFSCTFNFNIGFIAYIRQCRNLSPQILIESPQDVASRGLVSCPYTINLYIQARTLRPTHIKCKYSAITQCCSENQSDLILSPKTSSRNIYFWVTALTYIFTSLRYFEFEVDAREIVFCKHLHLLLH